MDVMCITRRNAASCRLTPTVDVLHVRWLSVWLCLVTAGLFGRYGRWASCFGCCTVWHTSNLPNFHRDAELLSLVSDWHIDGPRIRSKQCSPYVLEIWFGNYKFGYAFRVWCARSLSNDMVSGGRARVRQIQIWFPKSKVEVTPDCARMRFLARSLRGWAGLISLSVLDLILHCCCLICSYDCPGFRNS